VVGPLYGEAGFFRKGKGLPPCYEGSGNNGSVPATTVAHWPVSSAEAGTGTDTRAAPRSGPWRYSMISELLEFELLGHALICVPIFIPHAVHSDCPCLDSSIPCYPGMLLAFALKSLPVHEAARHFPRDLSTPAAS